MPVSAPHELRFVNVSQDDELAGPMLAELATEYGTRYDDSTERVYHGLLSYPADEFAPPHGGMLMGLLDSVPVTGGAFRNFGVVDGLKTAELKRVWTDRRYRRQGLATLLMDALEAEIVARGYLQVYLTTGHRQPEAEALYLARGYTRLGAALSTRTEVYSLEVSPVAFAKELAKEPTRS